MQNSNPTEESACEEELLDHQSVHTPSASVISSWGERGPPSGRPFSEKLKLLFQRTTTYFDSKYVFNNNYLHAYRYLSNTRV